MCWKKYRPKWKIIQINETQMTECYNYMSHYYCIDIHVRIQGKYQRSINKWTKDYVLKQFQKTKNHKFAWWFVESFG